MNRNSWCRGLPLLLLATVAGAADVPKGTPASTRGKDWKISVFAGTGTKGFSGDGGPATEARLDSPNGISQGPDGTLYICDTGNHRIRKVTPDGRMETVAGSGQPGWSGDGGPALAAKLNEPYEVRLNGAGDLFWVERLSHSVRRRDAKSGRISTIAGTGDAGFSGDDGPANRAQMSEPHSIGFDKADDLYICDVRNHRVRKVDMRTGIITTFCGTGERKTPEEGSAIAGAALNGPRALDFDAAGNLWLALREGNRILEFNLAKGTIHRAAGTGARGFTGNGGPAREATLSGPKGLSVGERGVVFVADTENHAIRKLDVGGNIQVVAGTGARGEGTSSDPLTCALARPHGVFASTNGLIFIGDTESHRILVVAPAR